MTGDELVETMASAWAEWDAAVLNRGRKGDKATPAGDRALALERAAQALATRHGTTATELRAEVARIRREALLADRVVPLRVAIQRATRRGP